MGQVFRRKLVIILLCCLTAFILYTQKTQTNSNKLLALTKKFKNQDVLGDKTDAQQLNQVNTVAYTLVVHKNPAEAIRLIKTIYR